MNKLMGWSIAVMLGGLLAAGCGAPVEEGDEPGETEQALGGACTAIDDSYVSYYAGLNCTGTEYGVHTATGGWDWDAQGCLRPAVVSASAYSMRHAAGDCMNWLTHPTLTGVSVVQREHGNN